MVANYPNGVPSLPSAQVDGTDTVNADDVNRVYDELTAVAATIGTTPATRDVAWNTNSYDSTNLGFTTVANRIRNVEDGVQVITNSAVTTSGAKTVTVTSNPAINLVMKAKSGQTGNLMEFRASGSETPVTAINPSGYIIAIDGGSA